MRGISSDVIALAAVLGSAAVAGVVTLALVRSDAGEFAYECVVARAETAPHVVLALNGGETSVVVAPAVQISTAEACTEVHVERLDADERHLERARRELERVQERMERSRDRLTDRVERERVERAERLDRLERVERVRGEALRRQDFERTRVMVDGVAIELEGLGELLDLELEGLSEALELELGGRGDLDDELARLEEEMKRVVDELRRRKRRKGGGGR